jgi:hypothetical protein
MATNLSSSPAAGSSPLFPGLLSVQLAQLPPGKSLPGLDKKVSQAAADPIHTQSNSKPEKVNYTSVEEITRTCLQCRELRAMVNEVLTGREMVDRVRQKVAQNLLESMEKECVRKIRQKRTDIDEIVQMHLDIMTDFGLYQSLVLAEIVRLRGMMKRENDIIAELLAKRRGDLDEVKGSEDLTSYDEIMKFKDIQTLVKTLKDLINVQTLLESAKLPFDSMESTKDQQFLIVEFKEEKLKTVQSLFSQISVTNLPKVKADELGTVKGELLSALTQLIHNTHRQIKDQLQKSNEDLEAAQEDLKEYEESLPKGQDIQVATLEALEIQFAFNTEFVGKLETYRKMSAEFSVLARLVEAENGAEYLLETPLRKALLNRRAKELAQFKEKTNQIEKLREGMVHWVTAVQEGNGAIAAIHQWAKEALKKFDDAFPKKDDCCPGRREQCGGSTCPDKAASATKVQSASATKDKTASATKDKTASATKDKTASPTKDE